MLILYQTVEGDYYVADAYSKLNETDIVIAKGTLQELETKLRSIKNEKTN